MIIHNNEAPESLEVTGAPNNSKNKGCLIGDSCLLRYTILLESNSKRQYSLQAKVPIAAPYNIGDILPTSITRSAWIIAGNHTLLRSVRDSWVYHIKIHETEYQEI
jgi:hypothetical protein